MSEFICPKTGEVCNIPDLCGEANASLQKVVPLIRRRVGGVSVKLAQADLDRKLSHQADVMGMKLHPTFDPNGDARICPGEAFAMENVVFQIGNQGVVEAISTMAETCVQQTISDLTHQKQ